MSEQPLSERLRITAAAQSATPIVDYWNELADEVAALESKLAEAQALATKIDQQRSEIARDWSKLQRELDEAQYNTALDKQTIQSLMDKLNEARAQLSRDQTKVVNDRLLAEIQHLIAQRDALARALDTIPVELMLAAGPPFKVTFSASAFDLLLKARKALAAIGTTEPAPKSEDTELLDWLEQRFVSVNASGDVGERPTGWIVDEWEKEDGFKANTLRSAIRAARAQEQKLQK